MNSMASARTTVMTTALIALLVVGCASGGKARTMDAGGMTRDDVAEHTMHEEFDLYSERYERMQAVMASAQRVLSDGEWEFVGGDDIPESAGDGGVTGRLPGMDDTNGYFLETARVWMPDRATGDERDLEPMTDYFTDNGWDTETREFGSSRDVRGATDDGWYIYYQVRENGRYSIDVYSGLFWTNDYLALIDAIDDRSTHDFYTRSRPGEYPRFPQWDDPVTERSGT